MNLTLERYRKAVFRTGVAAVALTVILSALTPSFFEASDAHAGVLLRNQRRIAIRLRRLPRMHLMQRPDSSSEVIGKTNPRTSGSSRSSIDATRQVDAKMKADEEYRTKYIKWREKQIKLQKRQIEKEKKAERERQVAAKRSREVALKKSKRAESIKEAPLNPWFGSKKAKETGVIELGKDGNKQKDPNRRVPLLKQLWRAVFG